MRTLAVLLLTLGAALAAQIPSNRYALLLEDPPVAVKHQGGIHTAAAESYRTQIVTRQRTLRAALAQRHVAVVGSVDTLLNAVFVAIPASRVAEMQALPGVKAVVPVRRFKPLLNRATQLVNAPGAWAALGGQGNAGAGIKIGILDSGIDQAHAAFQDPSIPMPAGFPVCSGTDCAFTNNKVIVARSYVRQLAAGTDPNNPFIDSRPDDYSARDRSGHGTAVASAAAGVPNQGAVPIVGMAPKAYLGNYKVYGTPGVNDFTGDDVLISALDDAVKDGMDVVSISSGGPALYGPTDTGTACGQPAGAPCDLAASAFETAAKNGLIIVASAGNSGEDGVNAQQFTTMNTVASPANAPSILAVGATTNSHVFLDNVTFSGQNYPALLGSGFAPVGDVTGPLVDITTIGDATGLACSALPAGSLTGAIALIQRGTCFFSDKTTNAQNAGAIAVIFYMNDASNIFVPDTTGANIPAAMISLTNGQALKSFLAANPKTPATIQANATETDASSFNQLAGFSSVGPSIAGLLKPDLVATGTSMYMAAQKYDPLGDVYGATGYVVAEGTSFSAPLVAGAAALVKQAHKNFTADQIRSALVNTASTAVTTDEFGSPVDAQSVGGGLLDAGAAVNSTVTAVPRTVSFTAQTSAVPVTLTNTGTAAVSLSASPAALATPSTVSLAPGASATVNINRAVPVSGSTAAGNVTFAGSGVSLHVPYQYIPATGQPNDLIPLVGDGFDGTVNQGIPDGFVAFRIVDTNGQPVPNVPVTWQAVDGGTVSQADAQTDQYGIAGAVPTLGATTGTYRFQATTGAAGLRYTFSGTARNVPSYPAAGVVSAADVSAGVAPGSYVSIYGVNLSDGTDQARTARLPLGLQMVNVSFNDAPAPLLFVSSNQINVQVPWELQGQSSVQMKVAIDFTYGAPVTLTLSDYAPSFFEAGGFVAALDKNYALVNASNPVKPGQLLQFFANGLGPVNNQPVSGDPAPSAEPLATTKTNPTVSIGGQPATMLWSGLAPGFAGLYQVDVLVPSVAAGSQPIILSIGGKTSKAATVPVGQ